jgi:hypothetical protein
MANWTEADIEAQMKKIVASGWIPYFEAAAQRHGLPVELLLAIASRETNLCNIRGDFRNGIYHGYGLMQVDIGTEKAFCDSWTAEAVQPSVECGAKILAGKRDFLKSKGITDLRAVAAAYNTGEGNVLRSVTSGADPDRTTTGGDYGRDVLKRMAIFAKLRTATPSQV